MFYLILLKYKIIKPFQTELVNYLKVLGLKGDQGY